MADIPPHITPPGAGGSLDFWWGLAVAKILPALAGAYVRNLFPPRKPFLQRTLEALGGVILIIYCGKLAAGTLWAALKWGLTYVGAKPTDVIDRADADLLSAFLVGLLGMTIVEGIIVYARAFARARAEEA